MKASQLIPHRRRCSAAEGLRSRFVRNVDGIAAVELSLVILPLFVLVMVIMEASILAFAQHQLDVSVQRAARLVRTGAFQEDAGADVAQQMRGLLCGSGLRFYQCDEMRFDLVRSATFAIKQIAPAYDASRGDWAAGFGSQLDCPLGGAVHVLRAAVPMLRPFRFLDYTGQRMPGGKQLLTSTAVFRAENYAAGACP
ncbi:MAG TPA: TadE/TadG family type IV pilus assembly protein [Methylobacterium sp.]|uniref:TadE/TadG family type IV pilus assembly protein n=1 Tax=Methylorubrum sp. B1-46 TaxID=2897334 RepID=UPI001E3FFD65|nr:TadE/TadG family type IV pilus assembly protein [Methylorubrum sp. B1-46]UGB24673.1 pilus assembly protein [Methylorubrum sp. B1-46]HEV2545219.1 TadE/TadG family type IV pilus assembly protein [Methylobacterium sp.]